jgi:fumarate reductase subunit D
MPEENSSFNQTKTEKNGSTGEIGPDKVEEGKVGAILAYIPFMCFVPLIKMRDNPFAVKHGKQGLILFVLEIIAVVFLLPKISDLFWGMVVVLCLVFALVGIFYALQGRTWKIPFIGDFEEKIKI